MADNFLKSRHRLEKIHSFKGIHTNQNLFFLKNAETVTVTKERPLQCKQN